MPGDCFVARLRLAPRNDTLDIEKAACGSLFNKILISSPLMGGHPLGEVR